VSVKYAEAGRNLKNSQNAGISKFKNPYRKEYFCLK
jgi:hypothetical protein